MAHRLYGVCPLTLYSGMLSLMYTSSILQAKKRAEGTSCLVLYIYLYSGHFRKSQTQLDMLRPIMQSKAFMPLIWVASAAG